MKKMNPWPVAITLFYVIFVAAVVAFAFWSLNHKTDLVAEDYYEQELMHQQQIDKEVRTRELDQQPTITYDAQREHLVISFPGQPDVTGTVTLYRPSDAGLDATHELVIGDSGVQVLNVAALPEGRWTAKVAWQQQGKAYYLEEQLVLR